MRFFPDGGIVGLELFHALPCRPCTGGPASLPSQSSYVCPMSVLPVAGEEAFLTGDVDSSLGSAVGSTVSDEL